MTDPSADPVDQFLAAARDETEEMPFRITGVMFQYYVVCKRELWFLSRDVEIDRDTPAIVRGSDVDDSAYSDKRRDVRIDGIIAIDVLDSGEILEVKPSSSMTEPARLQLLFYLWYLDRVTGVEKTGVLAHPTEKRRETIKLTTETIVTVRTFYSKIVAKHSGSSRQDLCRGIAKCPRQRGGKEADATTLSGNSVQKWRHAD